jgi:AcrR family transcriptional regulator
MDAAFEAVADKGLAAVQLRDVARAADLTPGAVLYYYEDLHHLLHQVYQRATHRYADQREEAVATIALPTHRLGTMLAMSVPSGPDDVELRILFEFDAMIFSRPQYVSYARDYLRRQLRMYESVLADGVANGTFMLIASVEDTARNLIALEDAHGFSVLIGDLTPQAMLRLLYAAAAAATGVDPAALVPGGHERSDET